MTLNPDDFTRDELVAKAEAVGAPTSGTKAELVVAIEEAEADYNSENTPGTVEWERKQYHEAKAAQKAVTEVTIEEQQAAIDAELNPQEENAPEVAVDEGNDTTEDTP